MHGDAFLWMFLPLLIAAGSALLSFAIMHARMEVAVSKEREALTETRAQLTTQKVTLEERIKATASAICIPLYFSAESHTATSARSTFSLMINFFMENPIF